MRKPGSSRTILTLALSIGILALLVAFTGKKGTNTCTVEADCPQQIENLKGGELLWESLSKQFVGSVSIN